MIPKRVALYLPIIFKSLLQIPMSISRFLRFQLFREQPHVSSSASTVAPPQTSRGIVTLRKDRRKRNSHIKPCRSNGGGGQTNSLKCDRIDPPRFLRT
uniref:Uncharacterized protein n=1 Tax=Cucumis melo TaxID=3656 RepID=A0A9I9DZP5_CUCME